MSHSTSHKPATPIAVQTLQQRFNTPPRTLADLVDSTVRTFEFVDGVKARISVPDRPFPFDAYARFSSNVTLAEMALASERLRFRDH